MAKTQEELNQLRNEYQKLSTKLKELTEDELNTVTGGVELTGFFGAIFEFPKDNNKAFVDSEDKQVVGELPRKNEDERYVKW